VGARVTRLLVAAAASLALAVLAVLLAVDVRSWRAALAGGDAVYAAAPERATWTPRTRLGGLAGDLLGVDDDVAVRRALQLYRAAATTHMRLDNATAVQAARAAAQDALLADGSSQARTLLGILTFGQRASGGTEDQFQSAVADFSDAVRTDETNDEAKFDLELLLRLSAASGTRPGQGVGGGFGRGGRRGAGGGTPGKGY
jgi:hypothetical protein